MFYRSILLPILGEAAERRSTQAAGTLALGLAKHWQGFVRALLITSPRRASVPTMPRSTMATHEGLGLAMPAEVAEAPPSASADQFHERIRNGFEAQCREFGLPFTATDLPDELPAAGWQWEERDDPLKAIADKAAGYDLVVLPAPSEVDDARHLADYVLMETGRPVLIVPAAAQESAHEGLPEAVLIAWDNSVPAWHAVSAALPFLQAAREVKVISVDPSTEVVASHAALTAYLGRYGVQAEAHSEDSRSMRIGEVILGEASDGMGGTLLVMGAYSHSPLRERILGGSTRYVLSTAAVSPVLLAH